MKRHASALAVPTNEPEMQRRDRLRMIMARLDSQGELERLLKVHEEEAAASSAASEDGDDQIVQYPFYTEGSKALLNARIDIAKYSIRRAASRLERARRKKDDPDEDMDAELDLVLEEAKSLELDCSEIGDDRPLSGCSFSHDSQLLATCMPDTKKVATLKGHTERLTDVQFSPVHNLLATASADRTARLWNTEGTQLYLGTTSFDQTWRLWDVETGEELLLQEGHSRSVYGIDFHPDGSLVGSSGLDALTHVWDLRNGRSILALEGHVKIVLALSFSGNGYYLATGGEDNTSHSSLISQVKFEPQEGYFLVTASYDLTAKIWSARDFKPVKMLSGHEEKVASLDISGVKFPHGHQIATVSLDRTMKLWSSSSNEKIQAMDVDYSTS
ncbi:U4/U6 small nuclear ribonucleoprotein PRP4-like protein [Pyrus ussuriensis x Pyrus communis]|uniref:U4/U6 small nuclear ribonucleoprotein PRP4-like protein n=1 Tax=Pyrus ussuriensis x Pyrus communis TaxID=2448454 RepID=A0A5N5G3F6_9ROSA|nr:U4/U6 small nuclear ribonucleoprotein PRP4-like protein [Pyrus ussuriensis x Pyrus communis]